MAATLLLAGCAKTVAGDANPVAGVAPSSESSAQTLGSGPSASNTPEQSSPSPAASRPTASIQTPTTAPTTTPPKTIPTTTASTKTATPPAIKWLIPAQSKVKSKTNSFGNLVAGLGKPYEIIWTAEKTTALRFIVDSATIDGRCEAPVKPVNGHFLIISVRVQLGDATGEDLGNAGIGFTGDDWTAFNAKNVAEVNTTSAAAGDCITSTTGFPYSSELAPGKVYTGKIALDVSSVKGSVVLMDAISGGWIYPYG